MRATRRAWLRSACAHCAALGGFTPLLAAAQSDLSAPIAVPEERFARPALDSEEAGLWALMDRDEARLRRSPLVIRDANLNKYISDLVCRLAGKHCPDVRVLVVRTPHFNASMAPNGLMLIWSGLLLRVENEAQLASVLAHELGHYLERHSLERMRDLKSRAALAQFFALFGIVGLLGSLGTLAGMYSFSREQEARADRIGLQLMQQAGFDGKQAGVVWDNLLGELKVRGGEDVGKRSPMFATHPPPSDRSQNLARWSAGQAGRVGEAEFRAAVLSQRGFWLDDELRRGQYEESLVLLDRLLDAEPESALLRVARAETYRKRGGDQDIPRALADLERATQSKDCPAEAYRALGLIHRQRNEASQAASALESYLARAPAAPDADLIKSYLQELKP